MSIELEKPREAKRFSDSSWIDGARFDAAQSIDRDVVIDISGIERIDSQQLSQLIRLHLDVRHDDKQIVLDNASEQVVHVIELTRLDRLFEIRRGPPARTGEMRPGEINELSATR